MLVGGKKTQLLVFFKPISFFFFFSSFLSPIVASYKMMCSLMLLQYENLSIERYFKLEHYISQTGNKSVGVQDEP